ncbi:MAG TPA: ROK family protein [Humisphaera sp.]
MTHAIGLDIGGTSVKSVVATPDGTAVARAVVPLDASRPDWPETVRAHLIDLERLHGPATHVGVAAPGIARPDGRGIWWMQGRLQELEGFDWTTFLGRPMPVPVLNDAQAALLAEAWIGAAAGAANVVLLTLGTGVGGAAIVDGRLLRGAVGRAGHLGHISLDPDGPPDITNCPGSLEEAVGNCSVGRRTGGRFDSVLSLAAAAARGAADARQAWSTSVRSLAAGLASVVNVVDPEVVVIGGGIAAAGDALFLPLAAELDRMEWRPHGHRVRVVRATLGEHAGAIGAARNAML